MTTLKKSLAFVLVLVLCIGLTVGATVAYLTDRDSAANIFTVGDVSIELSEKFEQGAKLIPGVDIEKIPVITNTGKNDAWVWLELAIPSALDNWNPNGEEGSNNNVIHWNPLGATTAGEGYSYVTEERVNKAIADGHLSGVTYEEIVEYNMTWDVFNALVNGGNAYTTTIKVGNRNVPYNVYVIPYNKALEPGETTLPTLYNVFLDATVDIDPEGNWYKVVDGTATSLNWNVKTNGYPVIYVSAYAIQKESFNNVGEAYAAYQNQWAENGKEWGTAARVVGTAGELGTAVTSLGGEIVLADNIATDAQLNVNKDSVIYLNGYTITSKDPTKTMVNLNLVNLTIHGEGALLNTRNIGISNWGNLTLNDVNVGDVTASGVAINNAGTATINGGVFYSSEVVFSCADYPSKGTAGLITINDAEVNTTGTVFRSRVSGSSTSTIIINGGTFSTTGTMFSTMNGGQIIVKGGSFNQDPSAYLADGYVATLTDGMYVVTKG